MLCDDFSRQVLLYHITSISFLIWCHSVYPSVHTYLFYAYCIVLGLIRSHTFFRSFSSCIRFDADCWPCSEFCLASAILIYSSCFFTRFLTDGVFSRQRISWFHHTQEQRKQVRRSTSPYSTLFRAKLIQLRLVLIS
jgi:hypothetical protein